MILTSYGVAALLLILLVETALVVWLLLHRAAGRRALRLLEDRLRFETLVAELSAKLIHVEAGGLDAALESALRQMIAFLGMDRGNLDEYIDDAPRIRVSCARPGIMELPSILAAEQFPWTADTLRRGGVVRFSRRAELPEHASTDRASYDRLGTRSHLSIPLRAGGPMLGVLSFDSVRSECAWPDDLVDRLHLLSEAFASALERKRMEWALAQRLREAGRLRQELTHIGRVSAMGELTASLAHELNQPLSAILNNAEVAQRFLEAEVLDLAEMREILKDIVADDKRAADVIRRLRALLKKGELEHASLDLNGVVDEVAQLVTNDVVIRNVPMSLDLDTELPNVRGDRVQLQQVVLNLVLNGLEAMREANGREPALVIRTSKAGATSVTITIEDSGTGIEMHDLERIFQPLYTTKTEGLGMGLAIARTIVDAHGGQLRALNNASGGATFEVTLPVETDQRS
jgi:C4-dicarboxylate-specific signal transduction histidine kinase